MSWRSVVWPDQVPESFGHWLAGFIDGDGNFDIQRRPTGFVCRFTIGLRADDLPVLEEIQALTGLGDVRLQDMERHGARAQARWTVSRKRECARLVTLLDHYPLRAKKRRDFEIWARAVVEWLEVEHGQRHDWGVTAALRDELRAVRAFIAPEPQMQLSSSPGSAVN